MTGQHHHDEERRLTAELAELYCRLAECALKLGRAEGQLEVMRAALSNLADAVDAEAKEYGWGEDGVAPTAEARALLDTATPTPCGHAAQQIRPHILICRCPTCGFEYGADS